MSVPVQPSCKRRLQILDDETRDAPRFDPGAPNGMSASDRIWVSDFMARLAASVRSLRRRQ
jgi:hypothetical protein